MTIIIGRRLLQEQIPIGLDRVIAAYPIPRGGSLNQIHLAVDMTSLDGASVSSNVMTAYGVSAYVVPVPDPDASLAFETAWDQFIPKDSIITSLIDLDTANVDTDAAFEPGQPNLSAVFDMVGLQPRQIFKRRKFMTYATGMTSVGGAALDNWHPADHFSTVINQKVRCSMYSYILIAASSPAFDTTTTTAWSPPTEIEWAIMQYLDVFIEQMFIASLNLQEAGAESPYEEAEQFISELLEEVIHEDTAGAFHPQIWNAFCRATFNVTVPGRAQLKTLTSEL